MQSNLNEVLKTENCFSNCKVMYYRIHTGKSSDCLGPKRTKGRDSDNKPGFLSYSESQEENFHGDPRWRRERLSIQPQPPPELVRTVSSEAFSHANTLHNGSKKYRRTKRRKTNTGVNIITLAEAPPPRLPIRGAKLV